MNTAPASPHTTVLLDEAVKALVKQPDGIYVDGTFGRGGHSLAVLAQLGPAGRLLAFDALEMSFREYKLNIDPENPVTYANRDNIKVVELDGLCMPQLASELS